MYFGFAGGVFKVIEWRSGACLVAPQLIKANLSAKNTIADQINSMKDLFRAPTPAFA